MVSFEKWASEYTWKVRKNPNRVVSFQVPNADIEDYGWTIIEKRDGTFFVTAYRMSGGEVSLPFHTFDNAEDAKLWAMRWDFDRQRRLVDEFRADESIEL